MPPFKPWLLHEYEDFYRRFLVSADIFRAGGFSLDVLDTACTRNLNRHRIRVGTNGTSDQASPSH